MRRWNQPQSRRPNWESGGSSNPNSLNYSPLDRREIDSLKHQIDFITETVKNFKILNDAKQYKSLLENLIASLQSGSSSQSKTPTIRFDLTSQIQFFVTVFTDIQNLVGREEHLNTVELYELFSSVLKTIRVLLNMNSQLKNDSFSKTLESFLDGLIVLRQNLCSISDAETHKATVLNIENSCLQVLKCITTLTTQYEFNIAEISKNSLCAKFIGILRCFSFYGIDSFELKDVNIHLFPTMIGHMGPGNNELGGNKKRRQQHQDRRQQQEDEEEDSLFNISSSVSQYSATEYSSSELEEELQFMSIIRHKKIHADIRVLCYENLEASLGIFGIKIVFGFWPFFFPEKFDITQQARGNSQFSVLWTILKDNSNRVKKAALNFMYDFFNSGKLFIKALVSETKSQASKAEKGAVPTFTTISQSLTFMVKDLHRFFDKVLFLESKSVSLILLYKVMSLVVSITPYNKISDDILHPLFVRNSFLLDHKVTQIKNLALVLYVKMFTPELLPKEFRAWLTENRAGAEVMNKIFRNCFQFIRNSDHVLLCSESIKLLSSIVKHHGLMIDLLNTDYDELKGGEILESLAAISIETLNTERFYSNSVLQCLICKFGFTFGMFLKHIPNKNLDRIFVDNERKLEFITKWFMDVLESKTFRIALIEYDPSTGIVQNSCRVTLINVISLVLDEVFSKMELGVQYRIVSLLMSLANTSDEQTGQSNNNDPNEQEVTSSDTRSVAIRCLSILQGLTPLCNDVNLIADLIQVCLDVLNRTDKTSLKKKKEIFLLEHTLWPLANVLDGVKKRNLEPEIELLLLKDTIAALNRAYDVKNVHYHTDDILVNLARCSALVVYIVHIKLLEERTDEEEAEVAITTRRIAQIEPKLILETVENMIQLLATSKLFKLQWNICISFSYLLELNNFVTLCSSSPEMLDNIFATVFKLFQTSDNHKVQSYAIFTICSICDLTFFNNKFTELWPSIVDKFIGDFNSVPAHSKQSWIEKYCFSLERVIKHFIISKPDVISREAGTLSKLRDFIRSELEIEGSDIESTSSNLKSLNCLLTF